MCAHRRLESTSSGHSRPRPWTGQLGGKLPVAVDSFARFARSSYLRAMRRSCTTAVSRRLRANSPTRHGQPYLLRQWNRGVLSVRRRRSRRWPEVRAARPQPIIELLAWRALRRRFSGAGASGSRQASRRERTSARRPFAGRRRAGRPPAGEKRRCRNSCTFRL